MNKTHEEHFKGWFVAVLENMKQDERAGFPIVMISFPLLERYLREKSGDHENSLTSKSNEQLRRIFPELASPKQAEEFWNVWRNGTLHQAFPRIIGTSPNDQCGGLCKSPDGRTAISIKAGNFWIHPHEFSDRIVNVIQSDFETFLGKGSPKHPVPVVISGRSGWSGTSAT
jgi:hypothetical protein